MATTIQSSVTKYTVGMFGAAAGGFMNGLAQAYLASPNEQAFVTSLANTMEFRTYVIDWMNTSVTNTAKAQAVVSNLLSTTSGTAYDQGVAAVKSMLDSGTTFPVALYTAINFLATTTDPTYVAFKDGFNTRIENALAYNAAGGSSTNLFDLQREASTSVTLTNGTDIRTGNQFYAGLVYTPGGDDRINSLQDEDQLTGIGATPKLTAILGNANDNGGPIITPKLADLQRLEVQFTGSGAAGGAVTALDLQDGDQDWTNIDVARISQAINTAEVGNIMNAVPNMSLANTNSNAAGVFEFSFNGAALVGANTGTVTLTNVALNNLNIGANTSGIGARGVGATGYETLNLVSSGPGNAIGTLNMPMDTNTDGKLVITGAAALRLGTAGVAVNAANNALVEVANLHVANTGVQGPGGRIAAINAADFTGNLTLVLDNILDVGKADTSGVVQNVTVTGGTGNDTIALYDAVQAGDSINGGNGTDNLIFYSGSSLASVASSIETATLLADGSTGNINVNMTNLPAVTGVTTRNISTAVVGGVLVNAAEAAVTFTLDNLSVAQAAAITIQHSTTGNNQIANNNIAAELAANTAADTIGITIAEGTNVDPRFNFTNDKDLGAATTPTATATFENVTITDSDTESNSVELNDFATHTGTITLTGGAAGTFLNLDVDTAGADVTANTAAANGLATGVQQGMLGIDTDGLAVDMSAAMAAARPGTAGSIVDVAALATQVRLGAATINAGGEAANVVVRVSTNAASVVGAQTITMGSGNDTVIFDNLNDARAGLTISDTVAGGTGNDTLVIDGNAVRVSLGASEWTNVSGFEAIRLVGNGAAALSTRIGENSYNLTLTNELIAANGTAGTIAIVNDNDLTNDVALAANLTTVAGNAESAVTIDARTLSAASHFSYKGEINGGGGTVDKFIFADANINGANVIDGGAADNSPLTFAANTDILEVRNTATVTAGDLANISNVGIIALTNDQATAQTVVLQLTDSVVDAMVDSYHTSTTTQQEAITIRINNAADITAPVAGVILNLDTAQVTARSIVNVGFDAVKAVAGDTVQLGMGVTAVNGAAGFDFAAAGDRIVLSAAQFGVNVAAVGTQVVATGNNIVYGALGSGAATDRIYVVEGAAMAGYGAGANDIGIYYDADGSGAGAAVLIGVVVDAGASVISGAGQTGLSIIA